MKVIALDFDGVIVDSIGEHYYLAVSAFEEMRRNAQKFRNLRKNFDFFRRFAKVAEDFYAFFVMMERGKIPKDEKKLVAMRDEILKKEKKNAESFAKIYFDIRKRTKGSENWARFFKPNKKFVSMARKLSLEHPIFIATTRDGETAYSILQRLGVEISMGNILSKDDTTNKGEQMRIIAQRSGASLGDIIFIEDNFENLVESSKTGIKPVLVEWGYNTPSQRKEARKLGIPVLKKKGFEKQLMEIIGN
ncbi:MAG: HAD family hydrolase [Candidatus Aenigmarchaeota archaeon]|nr:HAD family hydrolase [Candidatus Aenigmarchaeota archaeon]